MEQRPVYAFPPPPMENNNVPIKETEVKKRVVTKPKLPLSRPMVAAPQPVLAAAPQVQIRNNVSVPTETVAESAQEKILPNMQDNDDDDDGVEVWVQEEVQEEKDESPPARKEENESSQPILQEQAVNDANENEGLKQVDTTTTAVGGNDEVSPSVQTEVNKSPMVDNPDVSTQVTLETRKMAAPPQTKTEQLPEPQSQPQQNMIPKTTGGGSFTDFMKQSQPAANPTPPAFDPESIDIDTISAQIHERKQQNLKMKNDSPANELLPHL